MAPRVYLCERRVDLFFSVCGAGKVLCSFACVLHDWCHALAPARCVSVSLHRLLLPSSACDCLRRPKLSGVHGVCKRKKKRPPCQATKLWRTDPVFGFCAQILRLEIFFFPQKNARHRKMARVLAIYVEKHSGVSQAAMGGRETHTKSCTPGGEKCLVVLYS